MAKIPTTWITNPDIISLGWTYDSPTQEYDDGDNPFDGAFFDDSPITTKLPAQWNGVGKDVTGWVINPNYENTNDFYSNPLGTYDGGGGDPTNPNYDAITPGESPITTKNPTVWNNN